VYNSNQDNFNLYRLDSWYAKWADPIITIATLLIAVFVWVDTRIRQWKNSLPKRLTIHFKDGDKYVLSYFNAILIGEHDVRAFGQQLGQQMNDNDRLEFFPGLICKEPITIRTDGNRYINYYEVQMQLRLVPKKFKNSYEYWIFLDKQNELPEANEITEKESDGAETDKAVPEKAALKQRDNDWIRRNIKRGKQDVHPLQPFPFNPKKPC
jgi:hypothetical protein